MFLPGHPKLPGAGRVTGSKNKSTVLREKQAAGAMETFRAMGVSLPELGAQLVNVLNALALAQIPEQRIELLKNLNPAQQDRLAKYCKMSVDAIASMMEFGYPKLARVDYVGDIPTTNKIENRMMFVLNISGQPGRPIEDGHSGNGHDDAGPVISNDGDSGPALDVDDG